MPCPQPDLSVHSMPQFATSSGIGAEADLFDATLIETSPTLLVSDNPETVTAEYPAQAVLWRQIVRGGGSPRQSRLFFWHMNDRGAGAVLGITLQNRSSTPLEIISLRGEQGATSQNGASGTGSGGNDFLTIGKCIAKAVLGNTLTEFSVGGRMVAPGATVILQSLPWVAGALIGGQFEILTQCEPNAEPDFVLRVAYAPPNHDLRTVVDDPAEPNGPHARGTWAGSEIAATIQYSIPQDGAPPHQHYRVAKGIVSARDFLLRADTTLEQPPTHLVLSNRANFGVVYRIRFVVQNFSAVPHRLHLFLNPRGGAFAGALRIGSGGVQGVPRLNSSEQAVDLGVISCLASVVTEENFELMVAGASSTPVALVVVPVP